MMGPGRMVRWMWKIREVDCDRLQGSSPAD
jgi:hypothetical protein